MEEDNQNKDENEMPPPVVAALMTVYGDRATFTPLSPDDTRFQEVFGPFLESLGKFLQD